MSSVTEYRPSRMTPLDIAELSLIEASRLQRELLALPRGTIDALENGAPAVLETHKNNAERTLINA